MDRVLGVALGERSYPIHLGAGLLDRAGGLLSPLLASRRIAVVTDANVIETPHPAKLTASLAAAGLKVSRHVVPAGEASKGWNVLEGLVDELLALKPDRGLAVLALGGGVVGDLAGFAAAILLRGVDFVQVPTTLLAQVDSSVGGKTGINSTHGKNLIGAFHQPKTVLVDTDVLASLPDRELRAGYAEVVKHGMIRDAAFFAWLEGNGAALLAGDASAQRHAIERSCVIKAAVVGADERELTGERALLNFGHTFAHAYEALTGYGGTLLHGEAVSLGMVQAAELSVRLGLCPPADRDRLVAHLVASGMPTGPRAFRPEGYAPDAMLRAMAGDKKIVADRLRFILLRGIGDAFVSADVPRDVLERLLADA